MDLKDTYGTDKELEKNGVWVDLDGKGGQVLVARSNNDNFQKAYRQRMKPYIRQEQRGTLDVKVSNDIARDCVAEFVCLNWRGIVIGGKKISYSVKKAIELFIEFPDFLNDILDAAGTLETYREVTEEENIKNSKAS